MPNPVEEIDLSDLFEKDPEILTENEIRTLVEHYRSQRAKFAATETSKAEKKRQKKERTSIKDQTFD